MKPMKTTNPMKTMNEQPPTGSTSEERSGDEDVLQALFDRTAVQPDPWVTERIVARAAEVPTRTGSAASGGLWARLRLWVGLGAPLLAAVLLWVLWPESATTEHAEEAPPPVVTAKDPTAVLAPASVQPRAIASAALLDTTPEVGWSLLGAPEEEVFGVTATREPAWPLESAWAIEPLVSDDDDALALQLAPFGAGWDPLLDAPGGSLLMPLEDG